jgi:cytochrome P450
LRKSFDLFDEYLDVRIHNKFFRLIGVSDNHIRLAEGAPPGDKVYDLLKSWMQREGLKADINNLLDALLRAKRSAENHNLTEAVGLSDDHVLMTVGDIFGAGVETTTTVLKWAVAYLIHYPQVRGTHARTRAHTHTHTHTHTQIVLVNF